MTDEPASTSGKQPKSQRAQHREGRLKAALKANMAKRKLQLRAKSDEELLESGGDKNEKG